MNKNELIETISKIIEPRLWGSSWNYPDLFIETDDDLEFHRNRIRQKSIAIINLIQDI